LNFDLGSNLCALRFALFLLPITSYVLRITSYLYFFSRLSWLD